MKKVLKIIFLSFICVAGVLGLLVGGMYLFGGFEEKEVFADNISFNVDRVVSCDTFGLKITTTTPDVNKKNLKLSVLAGGESVIDIDPKIVEIDQVFTVVPKETFAGSGINFGGNARLIATYDYENAPQIVAYCDITIDVPIEKLDFKKDPIITSIGQTIPFIERDEEVSSVFDIEPEHALMPQVNYSSFETDLTNKKMYLQFAYSDINDVSFDKNIAQFIVNGQPQTKDYIEVNYSYREVGGTKKIVFDDNISIETYEESNACIKAYIYSTYDDQQKNTVDGVVNFNKLDTKSSTLPLTIGTYTIEEMTIIEEDRHVYLDEDCYIYLNNPNVTGNNINLGMQLITNVAGKEAFDYYLLNTYIKTDYEEYRLLKNNLGDDAEPGDWLPIKYNGIESLDKTAWRWQFKVTNFLAYESEEPFKIEIRYYHKNDNNEIKEFIKYFNIYTKIHEVDDVSTVYPTGKSYYEVVSGSRLELGDINFVSEPSIDGNDNYKYVYCLSYSENYEGGHSTIDTVPDEIGGNYKVTFEFMPNVEGQCNTFLINLNANSLTGWCELYEISYIQDEEPNINITDKSMVYNPQQLNPYKKVFVELKLELKAKPTSEDLFVINAQIIDVETSNINYTITDFETKFYKEKASGEYSEIPYLAVDGVRYNVEFNSYKDSKTNARYLVINTDTNGNADYNKVSKIGTIYITAQLVYVENNIEYWLNKSATARIEVYETLTDLRAFKYDSDSSYQNKFNDEITINENEGSGSIFITSNELESLKNFVEAGKVEIVVEQVFNSDEDENKSIINAYPDILNINKNTILLSSNWVPVKDPNIVGYKISYTVGEVHEIEIAGVTLDNYKFRITIRIESLDINATFIFESDSKQTLPITVNNKVLESAEIKYNNDIKDTNKDNPLAIYATGVTGDAENNEVVYHFVDGGSKIDFSKLDYNLIYSNEDTTKETLSAKFEVVNSNFNLVQGYHYTFKPESGGLKFFNLPRTDDGIIVKFTITSLSVEDINSRYIYNEKLKIFKQEIYNNILSELYFKIYGFDIVIESNDIEISGTADGKLKLLGNETDSLFSVNINGKNPGGQITSISNFSSYFQFFNIYVDNIDLFVNTDGKLDFAGNSLTFARDLMKDEEVGFSFYVGDQKLSSNTIAINGSTDGYYVKTIKSPFVVEWVDQFDAPSANQDFITITYDGGDYSQKLSIVELSYISSNLNPSYNIESPIIVEGDYKLSFKAVPLQNEEDATYTATMKLVLQNIESGERITLTHDITVTCQITNFDIEVGKEDVDAGSQPYHYIYAGGTYSVLGGDINISGKLKENINDVKDITVEFEDVDWQVEDSLNIEASKHMTATKYSKDKNDFSLICNDLNYQKTIKIIFNVEFDNGGKVVISKNVVVKPNLHAKLEFDFYEEEEEIILTDSIYMQNSVGGDYNKVEIENFSYENLDANYNKNSFIISNKAFTNISHFSNFEDFNVKVNKGAAALSEQERTIVFTYVTAKYTLVFNIVVDITDIDNISDEDLVIGNYTEDSGGYYYITAGSTLKSSDSTGVQFSDRLRRNIKHLNDKDVEINLTTVSHEGESDVNNMTYKFENGELELSCGALNFKKVIKIVVTFDFKAEGMVAFEKQITILPNLFIKLDKNSFKEGESFDLVQNLLYKEGEESEYQKLDIDFNYRNASDDAKYSIRSFGINENAFVPETETGEELLITVNTDASTLPEENRRITFKYKVDFNGDFYELVYNFVVEITAQ